MKAEDKILTLTEAAAELRMGYGTLRRRIAQSDGPKPMIIGGRAFMRRSDIMAWLEGQQAKSQTSPVHGGGLSAKVQ